MPNDHYADIIRQRGAEATYLLADNCRKKDKTIEILRSHVHVLRKTLASIKFCPDCGGDWCHLVDERVAEPLSGPGDCAEKGYCKAFMEIERKRDAALAATETKES